MSITNPTYHKQVEARILQQCESCAHCESSEMPHCRVVSAPCEDVAMGLADHWAFECYDYSWKREASDAN